MVTAAGLVWPKVLACFAAGIVCMSVLSAHEPAPVRAPSQASLASPPAPIPVLVPQVPVLSEAADPRADAIPSERIAALSVEPPPAAKPAETVAVMPAARIAGGAAKTVAAVLPVEKATPSPVCSAKAWPHAGECVDGAPRPSREIRVISIDRQPRAGAADTARAAADRKTEAGLAPIKAAQSESAPGAGASPLAREDGSPKAAAAEPLPTRLSLSLRQQRAAERDAKRVERNLARFAVPPAPATPDPAKTLAAALLAEQPAASPAASRIAEPTSTAALAPPPPAQPAASETRAVSAREPAAPVVEPDARQRSYSREERRRLSRAERRAKRIALREARYEEDGYTSRRRYSRRYVSARARRHGRGYYEDGYPPRYTYRRGGDRSDSVMTWLGEPRY